MVFDAVVSKLLPRSVTYSPATVNHSLVFRQGVLRGSRLAIGLSPGLIGRGKARKLFNMENFD